MSKTTAMPVTRALRFHLVTLFPESCSSYIQESIIARAQLEKRIGIYFYNPRDFVKAKKKFPAHITKEGMKPYLRVDDKPYGGGPGMVMEAMPVIKAIEAAIKKSETLAKKAPKTKGNVGKSKPAKSVALLASKNSAPKKPVIKVIFLSPGGEQFSNEKAMQWVDSKTTDIIILCGRYEGIDERVNTIFKSERISVGPFVTTGGELPALIILDAVARHIPGVLGNFDSREEARTASHAVYTRPEVLEYKGKKYKVPPVLISGDHKKIEEWRAAEEKAV